MLYLPHVLQCACHGECVACLHLIACVEGLQSDVLHVGDVWSHVCTEIHQHLLPHALGEVWRCAVVYDQASYRCCSAREIFRTRHHLDVNAKRVGVELCEGNHRGVGNEGNIVPMCNLCQGGNVSHLHLWVCYYLHENASRVAVNGSFHLSQVGEVNKLWLHAEAQHSATNEGIGVAKHVS